MNSTRIGARTLLAKSATPPATSMRIVYFDSCLSALMTSTSVLGLRRKRILARILTESREHVDTMNSAPYGRNSSLLRAGAANDAVTR